MPLRSSLQDRRKNNKNDNADNIVKWCPVCGAWERWWSARGNPQYEHYGFHIPKRGKEIKYCTTHRVNKDSE